MPEVLTTLAEWRELKPRTQGYVLYMEAEHEGSELKGQTCPYEKGTPERAEWDRGQAMAVQFAQDSEE